jgi:hypothetical protein
MKAATTIRYFKPEKKIVPQTLYSTLHSMVSHTTMHELKLGFQEQKKKVKMMRKNTSGSDKPTAKLFFFLTHEKRQC